LADRNVSSFRLSVVIPTHNRAATIERAVKSVLAQDAENLESLEVIVVDDASTDATERVIGSLADQRIRYIRHETNRGAPAARNTGIAAANGDLIAFQDSDDEWKPEKLAKQLQVFGAGKDDVFVVYCGLLLKRPETRIYFPEPWVADRQGNILEQLLHGNFVSTQTMVVRRECLEKSGCFDEELPRFQDWDLAIRLAKHYPFHLVDEPLVVAHETPGNISSDTDAAVTAMELVLRKHRALFGRHRGALADHLFFLGDTMCLNGAVSIGRRRLVAAIRARSTLWKAWFALGSSLFGASAYRLATTSARRWKLRLGGTR
jgi:glycosyltransferase involved in cell wall biosynthesis